MGERPGRGKDKAREELVELDRKVPSGIHALMLDNLDALSTTKASWNEVAFLVLRHCVARRGQYHTSTPEPQAVPE